MRDFWININEKYQKNKTVIWFVAVAIVFFLLVTRNMDKMAQKTGGSGNNATSGSVSNEISKNEQITKIAQNTEDSYNTVSEQAGQIRMSRTELIKLFTNLCDNKKYEAAYGYLSDECKAALYPTKESFVESYCSVIFKAHKNAEITSFKNDTYMVKFKEDSISTGTESKVSDAITDYITVDDNWKINVSGFIKTEKMEVTSIAPYFTVYATEKKIFTDYEELKIKVKNNTKADIYINDANNSNLYMKNENGNIYAVDTSDMLDTTYYVPAGSESEIKLKFNINYIDNNKMTELVLNNILIKNKDYYDSTSQVKNPTTGQIEYEKKTTNYPTNYMWTVKLQ